MEILFTRQRHEAKKAGLHWDYRIVVGDKAYSWATKKELPEPGKSIVLYEQPVHTADYALSQRVEIPDGQYGAGVTTLDWVKKGHANFDHADRLTVQLHSGEKFLLKKVPNYDEKAWLFRNITPKEEQEKQAYYTRHKYKEVKSVDEIPGDEDLATSVKYDGSHFYLAFDSKGKPRLFSRRQSVKGHYPERTEQLPHLTNVELPEHKGEVYSVELIHTGKDKNGAENHAHLSGILNSKKDRSIATQSQTGPVRMVLLDTLIPQISTYRKKLEHMSKLESNYGKPDEVWAVKPVFGREAAQKLHEETLAKGSEGVITTHLDLPEDDNVRYKVKNFQTYNVKVSGKTQEVDIEGNPKESAGALLVEDATGRPVGKVGTGFSRDQRKDIWDNYEKNWHGKLIQVKAFSSHKGNLRHPVYNGDSDGKIDTVR